MRKFCLVSLLFFTVTACENMGAGTATPDLSNRKSTLKRIAENVKKSGDVQAAAQLEAQIIEMDQSDPSSFINLADNVKSYGSRADVLDILQEGEKHNPESAELKIALVKFYLEDNHPEKALAKLEEIKGDKSRDYYNFKGVALDLQGEYKQAQKVYKQGLEEYQRDNLLLNNLALSKLLTRDLKQAISILKELVERNAGGVNSSKYENNLALAYGMNGDAEKAQKILGRELKPEEIEENLRIYKELR
jgi:Flp pilus assembly protein TadD